MKNQVKIILFFTMALVSSFSLALTPSGIDVEKARDENLIKIKNLKVQSISDLKNLTPFESVSVIQKRYLQKTFRGELNLSVASIINNEFFYLGGGSGHLGVFLREDHGIGVEGYKMYTNEKLVTLELIGPPNHIVPYALIISRSYGGAYYKWSPVFGKFAFLNQSIVYFDMFLTVGGGMTKVGVGIDANLKKKLKDDSNISSPLKEFFPTGSLGIGQTFALNKNFGMAWNLKWFFYLYRLVNNPQKATLHSDLKFSVGFNYYFPGAKYR